MNTKTRRVVGWAVFAAVCAVSALIYLLLPDTLAIQLASGGAAGNTAPKLVYILLFTGAELVISILNHGDAGTGRARWLLVSAILCAAHIAVLVMNLTVFKGLF